MHVFFWKNPYIFKAKQVTMKNKNKIETLGYQLDLQISSTHRVTLPTSTDSFVQLQSLNLLRWWRPTSRLLELLR